LSSDNNKKNIMKTSKQLNADFKKLNKEYMTLDNANGKETNETVLFANYHRMDAIQKEMAIIADMLEND